MTGILTGIFSQFEEERGRLFLWLPVMIAFGIALYFSLGFEPSLFSALAATLLISLMSIGAFYLKSRHPNGLIQGGALILIAILGISVGLTAAKIRENLVHQPILDKKTFVTIEGQITQIDASRSKKRVEIEIFRSWGEGPELPHRVRVTDTYKKLDAAPGDYIEAKLTLLPLPLPTHPGAYDFQRHLYFEGLGAAGVYTGGHVIPRPENVESDANRALQFFEYQRHQIGIDILEAAPKETAGFLLAIMTGERKALIREVQEDMRKSGLAHLLAISGLHMGMLGGTVFFLLRLFGAMVPPIALSLPLKKIAACAALISMAGYLMVSGMSVSAVRAFLMISLIFVAILFDRRAISFRNLAVAAIIILLIRPESLLGASFQMSFAAVFCLIAIYERYGTRFWINVSDKSILARGVQYIAAVLMTSVIASLATAPFAAFHFGEISLLGNIANLIAVPLMGIWVMPWVLISFLLYPLGGMEIGIEFASLGVMGIQATANWVAHLPYASLKFPEFAPELLIGIVLAVLWFLIWRKSVRYLAVIFLMAGIGAQIFFTHPDILISDTGRLVMIRLGEDIFVNDRRVERFERVRWQQIYGRENSLRFDDPRAKAAGMSCDEYGCVVAVKGQLIALSRSEFSLNLDCEKADILISSGPVMASCNRPEIIIDRFDVWRGGGHSLWLTGKKNQIKTVNGTRGDRPWVPRRSWERPE